MNDLSITDVLSAVHLLGLLFASSCTVIDTAYNIILSLEDSFLGDGVCSDNYKSEEDVWSQNASWQNNYMFSTHLEPAPEAKAIALWT
jgi:hypothetical protein